MLESKFKELFSKHYTENQTPSMIFCVFNKDYILSSDSYSLDSKYQVNNNTQFRIASMSKSFLALAILDANKKGYLKLNDKISKYLTVHKIISDVTIHQLLSMSSGLTTDDPWADRLLGISDVDFTEILKEEPCLIETPKCNYSNYGYMLLGRVLSTSTSTHALEYISNYIINPLGLIRTSWNPIDSNFSEGNVLRDGNWLKEDRYQTTSDSAVFGGLWSTIEDLIIWVRFLSSENHNFNLKDLLSPNYPILSMSLPFGPMETRSYAYGLRVSEIERIKYISHSGGLPGYSSHMRWCEESGMCVVALTNGTYSPIWNICAEAIHSVPQSRHFEKAVYQLAGDLIDSFSSDFIREEAFSHNFFLDFPRSDFAELKIKLQDKKVLEVNAISTYISSGLAGEINYSDSVKVYFELSPFLKVQKLKVI